jgi:hypothetical protein
MRLYPGLAFLAAATAAACGAQVIDPGASAGATTGAGGAPASTTSASSADGTFVDVGSSSSGLPVIDSGVSPAACLARPEGCPPPEDPGSAALAAQHLGDLVDTCGLCGFIEATFDDDGCAVSFGDAMSNPSPAGIACLAQHLNEVRWSCASGLVVDAHISCTIK